MVLASGKTVVQSGESVSSAQKHKENMAVPGGRDGRSKKKGFYVPFYKDQGSTYFFSHLGDPDRNVCHCLQACVSLSNLIVARIHFK